MPSYGDLFEGGAGLDDLDLGKLSSLSLPSTAAAPLPSPQTQQSGDEEIVITARRMPGGGLRLLGTGAGQFVGDQPSDSGEEAVDYVWQASLQSRVFDFLENVLAEVIGAIAGEKAKEVFLGTPTKIDEAEARIRTIIERDADNIILDRDATGVLIGEGKDPVSGDARLYMDRDKDDRFDVYIQSGDAGPAYNEGLGWNPFNNNVVI